MEENILIIWFINENIKVQRGKMVFLNRLWMVIVIVSIIVFIICDGFCVKYFIGII